MPIRSLAVALGCLAPAIALANGGNRPLVVELFTSQGCSSCPPADAYLLDLSHTRPDLLALSFHVTYWNSLGWTDPFSLAEATQRQRWYGSLSSDPQVYTPEMVIEGQQNVVGSDRGAVASALQRAGAAAVDAAPVQLARTGDSVEIQVGPGAGRGTVWLIGFDRQHRTSIGRGENGGRTLVEANVVREIKPAGAWTGQPLRLRQTAPAGEDIAVIVQDDSGRVLGAGRLAGPAS
jgi:hypothetical protein